MSETSRIHDAQEAVIAELRKRYPQHLESVDEEFAREVMRLYERERDCVEAHTQST